jgi:hypothetical protein
MSLAARALGMPLDELPDWQCCAPLSGIDNTMALAARRAS